MGTWAGGGGVLIITCGGSCNMARHTDCADTFVITIQPYFITLTSNSLKSFHDICLMSTIYSKCTVYTEMTAQQKQNRSAVESILSGAKFGFCTDERANICQLGWWGGNGSTAEYHRTTAQHQRGSTAVPLLHRCPLHSQSNYIMCFVHLA